MKPNLLGTFRHPEGEVSSVLFLNGNRNVATAGFSDGSARIWDMKSCTEAEVVLQHGTSALCLAASPDGHWLVSGGHDGLKVFDLYRWNEAPAWGPRETVYSVAFDSQSRRVAVYYSRMVQITEVQSQTLCEWFRTSGWDGLQVAFTPKDAELILTDFYFTRKSQTGGGTGANLVQRWSIGSERVVTRYRSPQGIRRFSVSSCGGLVAATCNDGKTRVWDAFSGLEIRVLATTGWAIAFHPQRRVLAVGESDSVTLWELDKPSPLAVLKGASLWSMVDQLVFSPDGSLLAATGDKATVWTVDLPPEPPQGTI